MYKRGNLVAMGVWAHFRKVGLERNHLLKRWHLLKSERCEPAVCCGRTQGIT